MSKASRLLLPLLALAVVAVPSGAHAAAPKPDPLAGQQWHLAAGGNGDDARDAWKLSRGGRVTVAVIDSGVNLAHPDLARNAWVNPGEIAGNGIDDDGDGYVDDVHGWDFVGGDADPYDENGHGTHVAGILAARGRNGIGGTGVAQKAKVMSLRVLDANNDGETGAVVSALNFAVQHGARVANLSLNTPTPDPAVEQAIEAANTAGMLVVVSAGNDAQNLDVTPSYPACSTSPNVIAVAATDKSGGLASFSNFGSSCVDLAAPGQDIVSTSIKGGYEMRSGTSMSAPQVAGAAVLMLAKRPTLTIDQLRAALLGTASTGAVSRAVGAAPIGRLDVSRAVSTALAG